MTYAWNEGGKEEVLEQAGLTLTHDELVEQLGTDAAQLIDGAGFVLVPRMWRDIVVRLLERKP